LLRIGGISPALSVVVVVEVVVVVVDVALVDIDAESVMVEPETEPEVEPDTEPEVDPAAGTALVSRIIDAESLIMVLDEVLGVVVVIEPEVLAASLRTCALPEVEPPTFLRTRLVCVCPWARLVES
jgi:hypothetical protein